jgi:hypothetical protein
VRRKRTEDKVRIPRLIVEFAVENKAKAKQQAEHRAQQQANLVKQKLQSDAKTEKPTKKRRGAKQRERKRKAKEQGEQDNEAVMNQHETRQDEPISKAHSGRQEDAVLTKRVKHLKKRKVDIEEAKFNNLVESYKDSFATTEKSSDVQGAGVVVNRQDKRWFE